MRIALLALSLGCYGCAVTPSGTQGPTEVPMTAASHGSECLFTFGGEAFVTDQLESAALLDRLRTLRGHTVLLQFSADTPYRCVGSAIITLQRAKVKFRSPQLPS